MQKIWTSPEDGDYPDLMHNLIRFAPALSVVACTSASNPTRNDEHAPVVADLAIVGADVFTGERWLDAATVTVADGKIAAVGAGISVPSGTKRIDGAGKTLLPGLIDAHTHVQHESSLKQAVVFGVTTEIDMFTSTKAEVPVLASTDAPNPGTAHGASVHEALTLLVQAGLNPSEALAAATTKTASSGGKSTAEMKVVTEDGDQALLVRGTIKPTRQAPWAGVMFFPGAQPMAPVNLSSRPILVFHAKSEAPISIMILATHDDVRPES